MRTKRKEDSKVIAGMKSLSREKAAEYVGLCESTFDKVVRLSRAKKSKVPVKFIQLVKGGDIWFPVKYLDEFVEQVIEKGCAI